MDKATHALYRECTEKCPEVRQKLQRMASVHDRAAFVRHYYRPMFDNVLLMKKRPFVYRVGQWYTKQLRLTVHINLVCLCATVRIMSRIDDGRYVDRQHTLMNERGVPVHHIIDRVEQGVRQCLATFDNDILVEGTDEVDSATLKRIRVETIETVRHALNQVIEEVKQQNRSTIERASGRRLPADVHTVIDEFLYGKTTK